MNHRYWIRQVRMTSRPLYDTYIKTIECPGYVGANLNFRCIIHGDRSDMSAAEAMLFLAFHNRYLDWRGSTDRSLTSVHLRNFAEFLESDFDVCCTFDDDAAFELPMGAPERIDTFLCKEAAWRHAAPIAEGRPIGAIGPMSTSRCTYAYDGIEGSVGELAGPPWMFYGCQFYTRAMLETIDWQTILSNLKYWSDFALLMEAHRQGFACVEMDLKGYVHRGAKGRVAKADAWPAAEAIEQVMLENDFLNKWFAGTEYIDTINAMHAKLINTRLQPRVDDPKNAKHRG